MKPSIPTSAILFACAAGSALADVNCTTNPAVVSPALDTLLTNSLVCGIPGPSYPFASTDRWQEEHRLLGLLVDYKLGPGNPVDPSKQVGTWSIRNNRVTYIYTNGGIYTWDVHPIAGTTYSFCLGTAEHVRAIIIPNPSTGCASFPPP